MGMNYPLVKLGVRNEFNEIYHKVQLKKIKFELDKKMLMLL